MIRKLPSDQMRIFAGTTNIAVKPMRVFDPVAVDFINEFSKQAAKHPRIREFPDIATLAFWCRRANIEKIAASLKLEENRIGRGLALHIAPANVPVNFAYSFFFGLLAGNANIVRVPSRDFDQTKIVAEILGSLFSLNQFQSLSLSNSLVQYASDSDVTRNLVAQAEARVIWGGDDTIRTIRGFDVPPRSVDVVFADRYSIAIIDAQSMIRLGQDDLQSLAHGFYNDNFFMDQFACSSAHLVFWHGEDVKEAQEKFWNAVFKIVEEKHYTIDAVNTVDKLTQACLDVSQNKNISKIDSPFGLLTRVKLESLPENIDSWRGHFGYFYEYSANNFDELLPLLQEKVQTITYHGISAAALCEQLNEHGSLGVDRIVPIGSGLDIGVIWDGYDIIRSLSRIREII